MWWVWFAPLVEMWLTAKIWGNMAPLVLRQACMNTTQILFRVWKLWTSALLIKLVDNFLTLFLQIFHIVIASNCIVCVCCSSKICIKNSEQGCSSFLFTIDCGCLAYFDLKQKKKKNLKYSGELKKLYNQLCKFGDCSMYILTCQCITNKLAKQRRCVSRVHFGNRMKAVGHSFQKIYHILWSTDAL